MQITRFPYTPQERRLIRHATYNRWQGYGLTWRLRRPYERIHCWLPSDTKRYWPTHDVLTLSLRTDGIDLTPTDGFADDDLLQMLGALESGVLGGMRYGKPPDDDLATRLQARAGLVFGEGRRDQPRYSRCLLGKDRVFWTVYCYHWGEDDADAVLASGEALTTEAAYQSAQAAIPSGCFHDRHDAGYASDYHRRLAVQQRLSRGSAKTEGVLREFLYLRSSGYSDYDGRYYVHFSPHLIIKRTATRVYVDRERYDEHHQEWLEKYPEYLKTVVVDRAILERDGHAPTRGLGWWDNTFYVRPEDDPKDGTTPACLLALQLTWPCTRKDIQRAFRHLVKEAHPDHGGEAASFRGLRKAYEEAISWISTHHTEL